MLQSVYDKFKHGTIGKLITHSQQYTLLKLLKTLSFSVLYAKQFTQFFFYIDPYFDGGFRLTNFFFFLTINRSTIVAISGFAQRMTNTFMCIVINNIYP